MKKTRFIALVLVAAIALMGAGYALWGDTIYLHETVKMGDVNVEWMWNSVDADSNGVFYATLDGKKVEPEYDDRGRGSHRYGNTNRSSDWKTYTVTIENLYPGATVRWTGQCLNTGSLPVRFKDMKVAITEGNKALAKYLEVYYDTRHYDKSENKWSDYNKHGFVDFDKFQDEMNSDTVLKGYVLDTEDRIQFGDETDPEPNCIVIRVKDNIPQKFENAFATISMTFNFEQAF